MGTPAGRARSRQMEARRQIRLALTIGELAYVYQQAGRQDEAEPLWTWVSDLLEMAEPINVWDRNNKMHFQVLVYAGQGKVEKALEIFEKLYESGWRGPLMGITGNASTTYGDTGWFEDNPMLDSIRNEPRFQAIAMKVKADSAAMLAAYKAGISPDDIIREDLQILSERAVSID